MVERASGPRSCVIRASSKTRPSFATLDISLDYLKATGLAKIGDNTQHLVASAVLAAWLEGMRHKVRLANVGIVAVERAYVSPPRTAGEVHLDALRDLAIFFR
jgi:hypothetical protein